MIENNSMRLKRCFDVALSIAILLLASPICMVAAIAVWLESGRPILFRQTRVGKDFVCFEILKFRTMRAGSDGPSVTTRGDARITGVGRLLRAAKIDEFPQFWNVLRGDMSIVGPRPEIPEYVEIFKARYQNILTIRPGITDLASICFRNEEVVLADNQDPLDAYKSLVLPAKLDLADQYVHAHSALRDMEIILLTAIVTLWPSAAGPARIVFKRTAPRARN
jgi:lipopolysaccharide/colanic/teichoic acid biosynthesis glycosyltransferase